MRVDGRDRDSSRLTAQRESCGRLLLSLRWSRKRGTMEREEADAAIVPSGDKKVGVILESCH